jgi:hypothetical protein
MIGRRLMSPARTFARYALSSREIASNAWEPVTSGVSSRAPNTFTPPQGSAGGIYVCQVTAKANGMSTAVFSPSFTVIN